ncbi:MAG TPA: sulfite exporter TauE/SafE family protein [Planctomycetota bacterium]
MEALAIAATVTAGLAMGAINNLAGGAGVFGLVAFEHACGLPLAVANPSLRPAGLCVGVFSFLGYLRAGQRVPLSTWLLGLWAVPGAPIGSWLALRLPDVIFWLYLAAVLALLLRQQTRRQGTGVPPRTLPGWVAPLGCFCIGIHMGYAQVGVGLLSTLVLSASAGRDLLGVTAAKSTLVVVTAVASIATFWSANALAVEPALWLALGTSVGAYQASRWAVARGSGAVRLVVIVVTTVTLGYALVKVGQLLASG